MAFLLLAISQLDGGPTLAEEANKLRRIAVVAGDNYQDCLVDQYQQVMRHGKLTERQFVEHISLSCILVRDRYRAAMVDLMAIEFPMFNQKLQIDSADQAVAEMQKNIVRTYIRSELHQE